MPSKTLIFVTGNANKLKEVRAILGASSHIEIDSKDLDIPEVQGTTREVAIAKCRAAAEQLGGPCITEDTVLCFEALHGLPGPYIKHFMKELGHDVPGPDRNLYYLKDQLGMNTFRWDPIFEREGTSQIYGEMSAEMKNKISHQYRALEKLQVYLRMFNS